MGMDVKDRNAFFVILGAVAAAGIVAAEVAHQSFTLPELLGGVAAVGVLFGGYVGLDRIRRRNWARALATVEDTHVRYFRTVQDGDNWLIELTYSYRPADGGLSALIQGRSSLQFHGHGRELTDDIQASAKAGRRMVVEYDPAAPSRSRILTNGEAPVFEG
jgi:hypothetical protein